MESTSRHGAEVLARRDAPRCGFVGLMDKLTLVQALLDD